MPNPFRLVPPLVTTLLCAALLTAGYLAYGSTGHDDSHITFQAARSLLTQGSITNYNGDRVEQSSSLLFTLLIAATSAVSGLDVVNSGYLLAIAAAAACAWLTWRAGMHLLLRPGYRCWPPVLLLASCSFLLWTWSGMESTLAALCLLWLVMCWARWLSTATTAALAVAPTITPTITTIIATIIATIATLTVRPEMPLLVPAIALAAVAVYRRRAIPLLVIALLLAAALLYWRHNYFGAWFPQPVNAKTGGALQWPDGLWYLLLGSLLNPLMLAAIPALVTLATQTWRQQPAHPLAVMAALAMLTYCGFTVLSGGDWMQAARFLVPVLPLACLLVVAGVSRLCWMPLAHGLLILLLTAQLGMHYFALRDLSHGTPVWVQYRLADQHQHYSLFEQLNQEHLRDMAVIDHIDSLVTTLRPHSGRPLVILSGQAGMVFFYTVQQHAGEVHFIDLHGLADRDLTRCAATASVPRSSQGLFWGYEDFFQHLPELQACGIPAPDIIYDLNDMNRSLAQTLDRLGYTLVHREQGFMVENDSRLPYNRLMAPNMIFVNRQWLPYLPASPTLISYASLPLRQRR